MQAHYTRLVTDERGVSCFEARYRVATGVFCPRLGGIDPTEERKGVLDKLRDELRKLDYLPILFDFDKPASKDLTGTVSTLAHMVRFIIADGTDPNSIPYELATIVPTTPAGCVQAQNHREPRGSDCVGVPGWAIACFREVSASPTTGTGIPATE